MSKEKTIIIAGILEFDPAVAEQTIVTARAHIAGACAEKGCVHYAWTLNPLDPGKVHVFEEWETPEDLAAHFADHWYADMGAHLHAAGLKGATVKKYRVGLSEPVYDPQGVARADFFTEQ